MYHVTTAIPTNEAFAVQPDPCRIVVTAGKYKGSNGVLVRFTPKKMWVMLDNDYGKKCLNQTSCTWNDDTTDNDVELTTPIDTQLTQFSWDHYNTINQVFGTDIVQQVIPGEKRKADATIRQVGRADEENPAYKRLKIDSSAGWRGDRYNEDFETHFVVQEGPHFLRSRIRDSIAEGIQSPTGNDTLCQSYALLNLYGIEWSSDSYTNQRAMIQFYRGLLDSPEFHQRMVDDVLMQYDIFWTDFQTGEPLLTFSSADPSKEQVSEAWDTFVQRMRCVLNDWENFGMTHFSSAST